MGERIGLPHIYLRLVGARIRADWQYRLSFWLFTASQFVTSSPHGSACSPPIHRHGAASAG